MFIKNCYKQSLYKKLEHPPLWNSKLQQHYRLGLHIPLPWPHTLPLSWISLPSPLLWNSSLERHHRLGPPLPLPRPRPLPATASLFLDFTFDSTSTRSVSRGKLSGRIKYGMFFPRTLSVSRCSRSLFFRVIVAALRCVFILTSTPVIVPCTCVPFFNSMVTLWWLSFIKNLTSFIQAAPSPFRPDSTPNPATESRGWAYEWPETLTLGAPT